MNHDSQINDEITLHLQMFQLYIIRAAFDLDISKPVKNSSRATLEMTTTRAPGTDGHTSVISFRGEQPL